MRLVFCSEPTTRRRAEYAKAACERCRKKKRQCAVLTQGGDCESCRRLEETCLSTSPRLAKRNNSDSVLVGANPKALPASAIATSDVNALLSWRQGELMAGELPVLVAILARGELASLGALLPAIVRKASRAAFRLVVHGLPASAQLFPGPAGGVPASITAAFVHHYALAVALLPLLDKETLPLPLPILVMLETVKHGVW